MYAKVIIFVVAVCCFSQVWGHGLMIEPPGRSALWSYYTVDNVKVVKNSGSNNVNCGGFELQWNTLNGKCGVCGDAFNSNHPQDNENTGKYGKYGPVRTYASGSDIQVKLNLTANHGGKFRYSLCVLDDASKPENGEGCFKPLQLKNGKNEYTVGSGDSVVENSVKLPAGLKCQRCVLRWEYVAGDKAGKCDDGKKRKGCGPQITFRNCADVTIH